MNVPSNRREFLKKTGLGLFSLSALTPLQFSSKPIIPKLGRVTSSSLSVYSQPSDKSSIVMQRYRDDVLKIYGDVISEDGPGYNPVWHRVWGGFVHSGFVQRVRNRLNPIIKEFPSSGQFMEVTVPLTQTYRIRSNRQWDPYIHKLYYSSIHSVSEVIEGLDGEPYYRINNPLLTLSYYVKATHLKAIPVEDLTPIHPEISPRDKRIEISLVFQKLLAFEKNELVREFQVSTGRPNKNITPDMIPTETPRGKHIIRNKRLSIHMGAGDAVNFRSDGDYPGVPWVSYFEPTTGVAIHGAYWHNNFGMTMSAGCINMLSEDAKWIYRWCTAGINDADVDTTFHTPVLVY